MSIFSDLVRAIYSAVILVACAYGFATEAEPETQVSSRRNNVSRSSGRQSTR